MQILDKVICIFLDVHLWTGRKKLRPEDLKVTAGSIPPEKLASLGSKKICDPAELAIFGTLKKRAERACEAVGIRFLGGYAIPQDKAEGLVRELSLIQAEFEVEKKEFLSRYDTALETWIADNLEWAGIIRAAVEPVDTVRRQLRFAHQAFRIDAACDGADAEVNEGLEAKVGSLGDRLLYEVSRDAEKTWEQSFRGKDKVTQKALRPIRSLVDKLKGLSFLDGRVSPMVARIETGLDALPKNGPIEGQDLNALIGLVLQLADPNGMKSLKVADWGPLLPAAGQNPEEPEVEEVDFPSPPTAQEPTEEESFEEVTLADPEDPELPLAASPAMPAAPGAWF